MHALRTAFTLLLSTTLCYSSILPTAANAQERLHVEANNHVKVLILGGGVTGIIAARTFHEQGIDDFLILEAHDQLGGRLKSATFGGKTIELGANWVQGTRIGDGPENPILTLVNKHSVKTHLSNFFGSVTTYDDRGAVDYLDVLTDSVNAYANLTIAAGRRMAQNFVDATSRAVYTLVGSRPLDPHAKAAEYFLFDWEYAQKPDQTSAIASSWNNNFTFNIDQGGFSNDSLLSIDQRGFKTIIQEEAKQFLSPSQIRLNSTVATISWSTSGVEVSLKDGSSIFADYALCTFSLGVLQNDDVRFNPSLPAFKQEAIASMTMATYTKIFLQFPEKFWFETEMGLYADPERGRYPVWQSLDHEKFLPGSGIISVTVTGDNSERIEALPDLQVKKEVLGVLQSMFPNITIPDPLEFMFPRWSSDPLYRGSYSNWPPSFVPQHHHNLRANVERLYFAGEATSLKYFGFLHGAYFEGFDMAKQMIVCIKHNRCVGLKHFREVKNALPYGVGVLNK